MTDWHEVKVSHMHFRWRRIKKYPSSPFAGIELEKWKDGDWHEVRSYNARDWFVAGMETARQLQSGDQGSLFE